LSASTDIDDIRNDDDTIGEAGEEIENYIDGRMIIDRGASGDVREISIIDGNAIGSTISATEITWDDDRLLGSPFESEIGIIKPATIEDMNDDPGIDGGDIDQIGVGDTDMEERPMAEIIMLRRNEWRHHDA
jgi:hypothetical protein